MRRRYEKMAAAASRIADFKAEKRTLRVLRALGLIEHRVERRVEQHADQARWRVVAAARLPLMTGRDPQLEPRRVDVQLRMQFQQRLVHRAELLRSEVLVVDRPAGATLLDERECAQRVKQVLVG
jgi:hypothetical protein